MRVPSEVKHKKLPVLTTSPKAELGKCAFNYVPVDVGKQNKKCTRFMYCSDSAQHVFTEHSESI